MINQQTALYTTTGGAAILSSFKPHMSYASLDKLAVWFMTPGQLTG